MDENGGDESAWIADLRHPSTETRRRLGQVQSRPTFSSALHPHVLKLIPENKRGLCIILFGVSDDTDLLLYATPLA